MRSFAKPSSGIRDSGSTCNGICRSRKSASCLAGFCFWWGVVSGDLASLRGDSELDEELMGREAREIMGTY